jgi:hypothetical protein
MNNIYDFAEIGQLIAERKRLKNIYVGLCVVALLFIAILCLFIENNILLTLAFALILLFFILFSVAFWKIKIGILNEYVSFLENIEIGNRSDYVGTFAEKLATRGDDNFEKYVFVSSSGEKELLIYKKHSVDFSSGEKYHLEQVGSYLCRWEKIG